MDLWTLAALLGGVVGFILALTGAGGGILAVPLLVFGLHLPMRDAAPIGLMAVGAAAAVGAVLGLREGVVRYRAAGLIGLAGVLSAPLGLWIAHQVPNAPLQGLFAGVLAWSAWRMLGLSGAVATEQERLSLPCHVSPVRGRLLWTLPCARALAATGLVSGLLSGMLGVGGGFVIVPALTRHTDLDARSIASTSLAVIALVSIGALVAAWGQGHLNLDVAKPFVGGAVLALLLGRLVAARLAGRRLQQAFGLLGLAVALALLLRSLGIGLA